MSAPAGEELRELERLLTVAAERGDPMSRAAVQVELQVGGDEAQAMLSTLREHGKAVEVAPGEWQAPSQDEVDRGAHREHAPAEPDRVVVSVPEDGEGEDASARRQLGATGERVAMTVGEPTVRLTMPIAQALDAEAIGKIVKAAIDGLEEGEVFVLEVTP